MPNGVVAREPRGDASGDVRDHAAAKAWAALRPDREGPAAVTRLQRKRKAAVFRLAGVGPEGSNVVAKHSSRARISQECGLYERVLPALPVPTVCYYGCVDGQDAESAWLFVEDAGDECYVAELAEHRALAARWLGLLHTTAATQLPAAEAARLPDRGPGYYLEQLRAARETIRGTLHNPALTPGDVTVLEAIVRQCAVAESRWDEVDRLCDGMPRTVIHGDFAPKNSVGPASASASSSRSRPSGRSSAAWSACA
jgi:hypothetical protein